jgi:hypothetical protein
MVWQTSALVHCILSVTHKLDFLTLNILLQVSDVFQTTFIDGSGMLVQEVLIMSVRLLQGNVGLVSEDVPDCNQLLASVTVKPCA